jgi:hypothetical protein
MTIDKEPRQQQEEQSLSQALLLASRGLSLQGSSIPGQQPPARMGPNEQREHLRATAQFALDITSEVDETLGRTLQEGEKHTGGRNINTKQDTVDVDTPASIDHQDDTAS